MLWRLHIYQPQLFQRIEAMGTEGNQSALADRTDYVEARWSQYRNSLVA
jgi:hypothetical protein